MILHQGSEASTHILSRVQEGFPSSGKEKLSVNMGDDRIGHENWSIFIGQFNEIFRNGDPVHEMEAAKQTISAYGK